MKIAWKSCCLLVLSLPLAALLCAIAPRLAAVAAQSPASVLLVAGLRAQVTVRRDDRGIPYIEAANDEDLAFAQGYVTASDRLWQMDLLRRAARGELAEIFGKVALAEDKRRRTLGFAAVAERSVAHLPVTARAILGAYASGVNAYIASCDEKSLPVEFRLLRYRPRQWSAADSIAVGKNFSEALSTTWTRDILRAALTDLPAARRDMLLPDNSPLDVLLVGRDELDRKRASTSSDTPRPLNAAESANLLRALNSIEQTRRRSLERVGLYAEDLAASNNWVVSGRRTVSGKPLLANDPHLTPSVPSVWHMVHLTAPGLRVAGVAAPGLPGVIIGHNDAIAWGVTNLGADTQDIYLETFDPEQPRRYRTPVGWREAEVRREEIAVRKSFAETATETVIHEVTVTRHGPIVLEQDGKRYALRWTALDPTVNEWSGFRQLNRARNWKDFCAALSRYAGAAQNFVYADVRGAIGYYAAGRIPIRKNGTGNVPHDGATDAGEWIDYIPFARLPHVYNPPNGLIVTANNRVVGANYPYYLAHGWPAPHRARRIFDLLRAKPTLGIDDFRAIQGDTYSLSGVTFARAVAKMAQPAGPNQSDERWLATVRLFAAWDGRVSADATAPVILAEMRGAFQRRLLAFALGPQRGRQFYWPNLNTALDRLITEQPLDWLPTEFRSYTELLQACHREAFEALTKELGADAGQWTWGRYALARLSHPLADAPLIGGQFRIAPFPIAGSTGSAGATPNAGTTVSMRFIADLSDWDRSRQGIILGVSGDPASRHWKDQLDEWRTVSPRPFPFTTKAVTEATKTSVILKP
jgi:penicillin amidase